MTNLEILDSNFGQAMPSPSAVNSLVAKVLSSDGSQAPAYVAFIYPVKALPKISGDNSVVHRRKQPRARTAFVPLKVTFGRCAGVSKHHLLLLFHTLEREQLIMSDSNPDDFIDLFSGRSSKCRVVWNPKKGKGILRELFRMMIEFGFITCPDGYRYLQVIESHFVYPDGKHVTGLKGGFLGKKAQAVIERCRSILQIDPSDANCYSSHDDTMKSDTDYSDDINEMFSDVRWDAYES